MRRKCSGAKSNTEDANAITFSDSVVEEHFVFAEASAVRRSGGYGRENVGMSNLKPDEKSGRRKSKVSVAMAISHGLGDPKAMAKAAADGKLVNIPALPINSMEGRRKKG